MFTTRHSCELQYQQKQNPCSSHPFSLATLNVSQMIVPYLFLFFWFPFSSKCTIHYCHNLQRVSGTGNNDRMLSNNSSRLATSIMAAFSLLTTEAIHCAACVNPTFCYTVSHCIRDINIQYDI